MAPALRDNQDVISVYLYGEWIASNVGLGAAFFVAAAGVFLLGVWVVRGDRRNRRDLDRPVDSEAASDDGH